MILPLGGRVLDARFSLIELLGRGGMASVWLARNIRVDKLVAIKLIRPEVARDDDMVVRFRSEARAAGRIGHPNICDILDSGVSPIGPYIVMEYLRGQSLGELLARRGRLPCPTAVMLAREALAGLEAAHRSGIIHRDLKPENLFLHRPDAGPPTVKLMDFGVAKFTDGTGEARTEHGALLGTPEYMAPEQFRGAAFAEVRTDIWAMGAILYRAITGRNAFGGPTVAATLLMVSSDNPQPIAELVDDVPPGLIAVIERCLRKPVGERWADAAALSAALAPYTGTERDLSPWEPAPATTGRGELEPSAPTRPFASARHDDDDGDTNVVAVPRASRDRARADDSVDGDLTPGEHDAPDDDDDTRLVIDPATRRRRWPLVAVLLGGAALVAALATRRGDSRAPTPTPTPVAAPEGSTAARVRPTEPAPTEPAPTEPAPTPAPSDDAEVVVIEGDTNDAPSVSARVPPAPELAAREPVDDAPRTGPRAEPTPVEPPLDPAGVVRVGRYVAMIATGRAGNHKKADAYCKALARGAAGGITRWELPNPTIAAKFAASSELRRGKYWTSALWRGRALALSFPGGEQTSLPVKDPRPRPLCVAKWP